MKIKVLISLTSSHGAYGAGEVSDVPDDFAFELLRKGMAEDIDGTAFTKIPNEVLKDPNIKTPPPPPGNKNKKPSAK